MSQSKTREDNKGMKGNVEFKLGSDKEARNQHWRRHPAGHTGHVLSTNTNYTYAGARKQKYVMCVHGSILVFGGDSRSKAIKMNSSQCHKAAAKIA